MTYAESHVLNVLFTFSFVSWFFFFLLSFSLTDSLLRNVVDFQTFVDFPDVLCGWSLVSCHFGQRVATVPVALRWPIPLGGLASALSWTVVQVPSAWCAFCASGFRRCCGTHSICGGVPVQFPYWILFGINSPSWKSTAKKGCRQNSSSWFHGGCPGASSHWSLWS